MKKEEWRPIPGIENYEVSSFGRIRSLDRWIHYICKGFPARRFFRGKLFTPKKPAKSGAAYYPKFTAGRQGSFLISRTVCRVFNGAPPTPMHEAAHLDSNTLNNCDDNLIWATSAENSSHRIQNGTHPSGEKNGHATLRQVDVVPLIERLVETGDSKKAGKEFGVTGSTVRAIIRGDKWQTAPIPTNLRERAREILKSNLQRSRAEVGKNGLRGRRAKAESGAVHEERQR